MLRSLRIRDFALIRELEVEFGPGLNLLTGETGSGKSILIDALGVILGEKSSPELVRSGAETAAVEGLFESDPLSSAAQLLRDSGIDSLDESLIIRREISASGRSRAFVNDKMASLALLKSLGEKLADIHGQHDQKSLLDLSTHLEWLDRFGENLADLREVRGSFQRVREIEKRLEALQMDEQERLREIDILRFQVNEIRSAQIQPSEKDDLDNERRILSNRERILALASETYSSLYESESSMYSHAKRLEKIIDELGSYDARWAEHLQAIQEARYKVEDLAYFSRDYVSAIDFSPERLEQVQTRLFELERLLKKYGASIAEILSYADRCERRLNELLCFSDTARALSEECEAARREYESVSGRLSKKRQEHALRLTHDIGRELEALAMEKSALKVDFIRSPYGPTGIDRVEFLVAPNTGEPARPLARIASGGELSRLMLAIRCVCGTGELGRTFVFDEVDAGIGGRVAEAVGKRLRAVAETNQVLCITHLPQIAVFARHHFTVKKATAESRTETLIERLDDHTRVHEIARMLGGEVITETTRRHAREMLANAVASANLQEQV